MRRRFLGAMALLNRWLLSVIFRRPRESVSKSLLRNQESVSTVRGGCRGAMLYLHVIFSGGRSSLTRFVSLLHSRTLPCTKLILVALATCSAPSFGPMSFRVELDRSYFSRPGPLLIGKLHSSGVFGAVKGGRSPAQRTLDGIGKAFTLKGLGLDAGFASCPRARPAASTSPPSGRG